MLVWIGNVFNNKMHLESRYIVRPYYFLCQMKIGMAKLIPIIFEVFLFIFNNTPNNKGVI